MMAAAQFSYERLHVHAGILRFLSEADEHVSGWDPVHAVVEQYERASESMLINLAEASRANELGVKTVAMGYALNIAEGNGRFAHLDHQRFLDIARRAATKLAARLDIAEMRGGIEPAIKDEIKALLVRVDSTTFALARTWKQEA